MIELDITETGKSYSPKSKYQQFGKSTKYFNTLEQAKTWLKNNYGNCSRSKIHFDKNEHITIHCGYIYGFKNCDWSHSPVEKWLQQDWVSFYKRVEIDLEKEK